MLTQKEEVINSLLGNSEFINLNQSYDEFESDEFNLIKNHNSTDDYEPYDPDRISSIVLKKDWLN